MKACALCILCWFFSQPFAALGQSRGTSFTNTRWKVKEFYINQSPVQNRKIDSLRFYFSDNGLLQLGMNAGRNAPSVAYNFNPQDSVITINDRRLTELRYKVVFFDSRNLVMTQEVPAEQDKITNIEYRMVPDL